MKTLSKIKIMAGKLTPEELDVLSRWIPQRKQKTYIREGIKRVKKIPVGSKVKVRDFVHKRIDYSVLDATLTKQGRTRFTLAFENGKSFTFPYKMFRIIEQVDIEALLGAKL